MTTKSWVFLFLFGLLANSNISWAGPLETLLEKYSNLKISYNQTNGVFELATAPPGKKEKLVIGTNSSLKKLIESKAEGTLKLTEKEIQSVQERLKVETLTLKSKDATLGFLATFSESLEASSKDNTHIGNPEDAIKGALVAKKYRDLPTDVAAIINKNLREVDQSAVGKLASAGSPCIRSAQRFYEDTHRLEPAFFFAGHLTNSGATNLPWVADQSGKFFFSDPTKEKVDWKEINPLQHPNFSGSDPKTWINAGLGFHEEHITLTTLDDQGQIRSGKFSWDPPHSPLDGPSEIDPNIQNKKFKQVSFGENHACGIEKESDKLFCFPWPSEKNKGANKFGQLNIPKELEGRKISQVSAGETATCASVVTEHHKKKKSDVYCWGRIAANINPGRTQEFKHRLIKLMTNEGPLVLDRKGEAVSYAVRYIDVAGPNRSEYVGISKKDHLPYFKDKKIAFPELPKDRKWKQVEYRQGIYLLVDNTDQAYAFKCEDSQCQSVPMPGKLGYYKGSNLQSRTGKDTK